MKAGYSLLSLLVALLIGFAPVWGGDMVNINSASVAELQHVDGIGVKTAEKIVAYRQAHGAFAHVQDLLNVRGMGEKRLAKAADSLTVNDVPEHSSQDTQHSD